MVYCRPAVNGDANLAQVSLLVSLTFYFMLSPHLLHTAVPVQQHVAGKAELCRGEAHPGDLGGSEKAKGQAECWVRLQQGGESSSCPPAAHMWVTGARRSGRAAHSSPSSYRWGCIELVVQSPCTVNRGGEDRVEWVQTWQTIPPTFGNQIWTACVSTDCTEILSDKWPTLL